ncbi:MAG: FliH/SctL family protein [Clostridia bacterium]|nr:FliH/SctL family protein [Clostridia bacterium]
MSNKIYKNYQVNLGIPFPVNTPLNFETIRHVDNAVELIESEDDIAQNEEESHEEIIQKARDEAEFIIKEAHYEASRIVENIEREAAESKEKIEDEARQQGYEDGYNQAKMQYEALMNEAEAIKEQARIEYKEVLQSIEEDAVNTILDIAKKVICEELSVNKESILYMVKQVFEKCANRENIVLKVSAEDHEYLIENKNQLLSMVEGIGDLEIKIDASLKVGACIVETSYGSIDAGMQTKLKKIEEAFRQAIGK